ncbi:MAG: universal stress protein [Verrucomicrobiales bacterium]
MPILTPTDFSEASQQAADVAAGLATKRGTVLRLVHSLSPWIGASEAPVTATIDELAHQQLETEAARLRGAGAEVELSLRHGSTEAEVAASVTEAGADLIVLGSGDPAAGHHLAGSVAERVAEGVPVPTLVVRRAAPLLAWLRREKPLRVLCAVDFSLSSDAALGTLKSMAQLGPLEVEAVHLAHPGEAKTTEGGVLMGEEKTAVQRDVWQRLHTHLGDGRAIVHVRPDDGHGPEAMAHLASDRGADLLVVGTRQIQGLKRLLAPSFSRGLLTHTSANLLCVPATAGPPEPDSAPTFRRVLVAVGFGAESARVIRHARALATRGTSLHLVHICPAPSPALNPVYSAEMCLDNGEHAEQARQTAAAKLEALRPRIQDAPDVTVTTEAITHTDPAVALCQAADRFAADVICLGSHGHGRLGMALLGSVSQTVIARAHRPVLVIPPPRL